MQRLRKSSKLRLKESRIAFSKDKQELACESGRGMQSKKNKIYKFWESLENSKQNNMTYINEEKKDETGVVIRVKNVKDFIEYTMGSH